MATPLAMGDPRAAGLMPAPLPTPEPGSTDFLRTVYGNQTYDPWNNAYTQGTPYYVPTAAAGFQDPRFTSQNIGGMTFADALSSNQSALPNVDYGRWGGGGDQALAAYLNQLGIGPQEAPQFLQMAGVDPTVASQTQATLGALKGQQSVNAVPTRFEAAYPYLTGALATAGVAGSLAGGSGTTADAAASSGGAMDIPTDPGLFDDPYGGLYGSGGIDPTTGGATSFGDLNFAGGPGTPGAGDFFSTQDILGTSGLSLPSGLEKFLNSIGKGLTSQLGGKGGPSVMSTLPGMLALNYARNQPGLDLGPLQGILGNLGGSSDAIVRAATDPFQANIAAGYGDILQSQGLRGIRGSSFGDTDIANYISGTGRSLANAGANAMQGSLALQGNLAGNIAQLQNQAQQQKNQLYGRAFDVLGRGLNPSGYIGAPLYNTGGP